MKKKYSSKDLSHHGIVSVVCNQIGIVELIDELIPPDPKMQVTTGECVKLMIINGLGFTSRPLYLESQFFSSKPIRRLLGRKIKPEEITDDRLGRCLDSCYANQCDSIFSSITTRACCRFNVDQRFRHLDTTSMSVHGEYEDGIGLIDFGYSKDYRFDLKQFVLSLMVSCDGNVPLLAKAIGGNQSDKTHFKEVLQQLKEQVDEREVSYFVADSALYTKDTIQTISEGMLWITRVPEVVKQAKMLIQSTALTQDGGEGHSFEEVESTYGSVKQRWLVVLSEKAREREIKTLKKKITREKEEYTKTSRALCSQEFQCEKDALSAVDRFEKALKYHQCKRIVSEHKKKSGKGRPSKQNPSSTVYRVQVILEEDSEAIEEEKATKGKFIIATNDLDRTRLSSQDLLGHYKEQQCVERGFRFLKDPLFMTSSVFLKNEERIVALSMIMCLCLLVYMLAQRLLRHQLLQKQKSVLSQTGKSTQRPTIRWIFQVFDGIHLLLVGEPDGPGSHEIVINLTPEREKILEILGSEFQAMYADVA